MKKCLKVIAVWLGDKRDLNGNRSTIDLIDDLIDNEINIENGIPTDVCLTIQKTGYIDTDNSLDYLNNTKTTNGKIFITIKNCVFLLFKFKCILNFETIIIHIKKNGINIPTCLIKRTVGCKK